MSTLYLDRKHTSLDIKDKTLRLTVSGETQRPLPVAMLEHIVITSRVELNSQALSTLSGLGIDILMINPRKLESRAYVFGPQQNQPSIRLLQYRLGQNEHWKVEFSRQLLQAKLRNHIKFLERAIAQRPDKRHAITNAIIEIHSRLSSLHTGQSLITLRGLEGAAARAFFSAYASILPPSLEFNGRKRRPPPDPVNALLSLTYTLLHYRAVKVAYCAGLDPMIGFLHEATYNRESLASDLIEPWRPIIDEWVWDLVRKQVLRTEDFLAKDGGCFLNKAGRKTFFQAFEPRAAILERALRRQVHTIKKSMKKQANSL